MTGPNIVEYWKTGAKRDKKTAGTLYESGEVHLPSHNLVYLAEKASVTLTPEESSQLKEISSFNLQARYDDYKYSFYKKATKEYTDI